MPERDPPLGALTAAPDDPQPARRWRTGGPDDPPRPLEPFGRACPATRSAAVHLAEAIGLHLLCPLRACRRARRCAEPDRGQLPLCVWQHRGTIRFALAIAAEQRGMKPGPAQDPQPAFPRRPPPSASDTLVGRLAAAGAPVHDLARAPGDFVDEWTWEQHDGATALVQACRPGRAGEPPGG